MLTEFAELVNTEMFWVVTEVCSEHNLVRRSKIIKQFIKIARTFIRQFNKNFLVPKLDENIHRLNFHRAMQGMQKL